MKRIKVHLKFPWKFIDSPYYRSLVEHPPERVDYTKLEHPKRIGVIESPLQFKTIKLVKGMARKSLELTQMPNITYDITRSDLIHCAHCLLLNKRSWIVDAEHYWTFSASGKISYSNLGRRIIKRFLERPECKKVLPWTRAARRSIIDGVRSRKILEKMEVLYPAVSLPEMGKEKRHKFTLLFIGRYFYQKGGLFVLRAFEKILNKFSDVEAVFISLTIPEFLKIKYEKVFRIYSSVSRDALFNEIYPTSHIFVYPGFTDTFGFSILEAMSFSLPIVTVEAFARNELVEDGKNGFIIERPRVTAFRIDQEGEKLIDEIVDKVSLLIENSSLRKRMGRYGRKLVERGKFSIKERNKKLKRIYEKAIER